MGFSRINEKTPCNVPTTSAMRSCQGEPVSPAAEKSFSVKPGFDNQSLQLAVAEQVIGARNRRAVREGPGNLHIGTLRLASETTCDVRVVDGPHADEGGAFRT